MAWYNSVGDWVSTAGGRIWDAGVAVKDAAVTAGGAVAGAVMHPIDTAVAAKNGIVKGWDATAAGAVKAYEWTSDKALKGYEATRDGIKWVADHPQEAWDATKNGLSKAANATASGLKTAGTATLNFGKFVITNPVRANALLLQGVTDAVTSTVGMVGDLGEAVLWNNTLRHVANLGLKKEDMLAKHEHDYAEGLKNICQYDNLVPQALQDWTDKKIDAMNLSPEWKQRLKVNLIPTREIDPHDPNANYERVIKYSGRAVGEVGAFIGVTVLTAGTGSAGFALARGGAYTARGISFINKAEKISGAFGWAARGLGAMEESRLVGALGSGLRTGTKVARGMGWSVRTPAGWALSKFAVGMEVAGGGMSFAINDLHDVREGKQLLAMEEQANQFAKNAEDALAAKFQQALDSGSLFEDTTQTGPQAIPGGVPTAPISPDFRGAAEGTNYMTLSVAPVTVSSTYTQTGNKDTTNSFNVSVNTQTATMTTNQEAVKPAATPEPAFIALHDGGLSRN